MLNTSSRLGGERVVAVQCPRIVDFDRLSPDQQHTKITTRPRRESYGLFLYSSGEFGRAPGGPMGSQSGYILTEIWKARPTWLALSVEERQQFFQEKIGPLIMGLVE